MSERGRIKVLIGKAGLDGHDRGAKVVAEGLRDEGMEVMYTGLRKMPEMIAEMAIQMNVDVVGLSCLAGAHKYLFPRLVELLRERGANSILVIGGGIIPQEDIPFLMGKGVSAVFGPGASIKAISTFIKENVSAERVKGVASKTAKVASER